MKIVYLFLLLFSITSLLTARAQSAFMQAQKSGWYPMFLLPVAETVTSNYHTRNLLDIGTGPGKLLDILIKRDSNLYLAGIDIDTEMINIARNNIQHPHITFQYELPGEKLAFEDSSFDVVSFCSVLFLLEDDTKRFLVEEALRVLRPGGRVIVLTPSGRKPIISSFVEVWRYPFAASNWTFVAWKVFTTASARRWVRASWLAEYAGKKSLHYSKQIVFNNNASIEIIEKGK